MNIRITFSGSSDDACSFEMQRLYDQLSRDGMRCQLETAASLPGHKSIEVNTAIALAGVALAGIGVLLNALTFYKSQQPKCTVTIKVGNVTYSITEASLPHVRSLLAERGDDAEQAAIEIDLDGRAP